MTRCAKTHNDAEVLPQSRRGDIAIILQLVHKAIYTNFAPKQIEACWLCAVSLFGGFAPATPPHCRSYASPEKPQHTMRHKHCNKQ